MDESPITTMIHTIIESFNDGVRAGMNVEEAKLKTIIAAYDRAKTDPNTKIPTYLHVAIEACRPAAHVEPS